MHTKTFLLYNFPTFDVILSDQQLNSLEKMLKISENIEIAHVENILLIVLTHNSDIYIHIVFF